MPLAEMPGKAAFAQDRPNEDSKYLRKGQDGVRSPQVGQQGNVYTTGPVEAVWNRIHPLKKQQRLKEGWKLFSPSTWKGLRDTAWGRKKADQRHEKRIAKLLRPHFLDQYPELGPQSWLDLFKKKSDQESAGVGRRAYEPAKTDNWGGLHADDVKAWGNMFEGDTWKNRERRHFDGDATEEAARTKQLGEGRMDQLSFWRMAAGPFAEDSKSNTGKSLMSGDVVDGYPIMENPGQDWQDKRGAGNRKGVPDIVWDVMTGMSDMKVGPASSAPDLAAGQKPDLVAGQAPDLAAGQAPKRALKRAAIPADDPELHKNRAYGMHPDDVKAWGNMFTSTAWKRRQSFDFDQDTALIAAANKRVGGGRMKPYDLTQLALGMTPRGPKDNQVDYERLQPGEDLGGYPVLEQPGRDEQDQIDDHIPDVVRDVFRPKGEK
jgi:hypothetical protein